MTKSFYCFSVFFGLVLSLIAGAHKFSPLSFLLFVAVFAGILIITYRVYLILERMGVKFYEIFLKEKIDGYKEAKKSIEKS